MAIPVITTKLFAPPPRPRALPRARLLARLSAGLHRRLTLVAAPAGFGKTSLVSAWVAGSGRPAAWLSLDSADSDSARFLAHLVVLFLLAGCGYLIDSAALLFAPGYSATPAALAVLLAKLARSAIAAAEIAFPLWLLARGLRPEGWRARMAAAA